MTSQIRTSTNFRNDINGLRAWAVLAVILYHFGVPGFNGGFVGVDVFFAISGFLMTGIVVRGLESQTKFSIWSFYLARAQRIFPALIALCAVLLLLGWWILIPSEYRTLGSQVAYSLTFLSNINFWLEAGTGYFDVTSHEKYLLHTWSLAVEWQFYLLLPLALLAIWNRHPKRNTLTLAVTALMLTSLAWCIVLTPLNPNAAFYLLPSRAWEMLAGSLVFLLAHKLILTPRQSNVLEAIGLGLIVCAISLFSSFTSWPGWPALVPVVGTVMVLLANRPQSVWTGNIAAQWLGTRSYSLYLWHWPVVVALGYLNWRTNIVAVTTGLVLTLVLGHLSWRFVETLAPRKLKKLTPNWRGVALIFAGFVVTISGALVRLNEGAVHRLDAKLLTQITAIGLETKNVNPRRDTCHVGTGGKSPSCMFGGHELRAIVIGDSHANTVISSVAAAFPDNNGGVMEWTYSGCPILVGVHSSRITDKNCGNFVDWAFQKLREIPIDIPVVIVNRHAIYVFGRNEVPDDKNIPWVYFSKQYTRTEPAFIEEYTQHLVSTACRIAKDRVVYLVRPIPEMNVNVPKTMARNMMRGETTNVSTSLIEYHQRQSFVWAAQNTARDQCGIKILDPLPYLCHDERCYGDKDGKPLYYDADHLSEYGNKLLVPMFADIFKDRNLYKSVAAPLVRVKE